MFLKILNFINIFCVRNKCFARGKTSQHLGNVITPAILPPQCVLVLPAPNELTNQILWTRSWNGLESKLLATHGCQIIQLTNRTFASSNVHTLTETAEQEKFSDHESIWAILAPSRGKVLFTPRPSRRSSGSHTPYPWTVITEKAMGRTLNCTFSSSLNSGWSEL